MLLILVWKILPSLNKLKYLQAALKTTKKIKEILKLSVNLYHQIKTRKKIINWEIVSILPLGWPYLNKSNDRIKNSIYMAMPTLKKELCIG